MSLPTDERSEQAPAGKRGDAVVDELKEKPEPPAEPVQEPEKPKTFAGEVLEFLKAALWAVGIALLLRSFVVEAYKIPSGSMLPTLQIGDHIFVNKFIYGFQIPLTTTKFFMWKNPHRGEVIVFKWPNDPNIDYIKRVIGEPGDNIEMVGEQLVINNQVQPSDYVKDIEVQDQSCSPNSDRLYEEHLDSGVVHDRIEQAGPRFGNPGPWVVPEGRLFMMGDNRDNSADSRTGWTVPYSYVKGRAMFVWLSWNSCGTGFDKVRYNRFGKGVR